MLLANIFYHVPVANAQEQFVKIPCWFRVNSSVKIIDKVMEATNLELQHPGGGKRIQTARGKMALKLLLLNKYIRQAIGRGDDTVSCLGGGGLSPGMASAVARTYNGDLGAEEGYVRKSYFQCLGFSFSQTLLSSPLAIGTR